MSNERFPVAIIGSGNIGTDLMIKILRGEGPLEVGAMIGIDPASDGLARAERLGVPTSSHGIDGLLAMPGFGDIRLVFDATSAGAHARHWELLRHHGIRVIDLTPAAIGPFCVPVVNLNDHYRCAEPQHGDLRWAGDDADRRRGERVGAGVVRRDRCRRSRRNRPARAPAPTSTSSSKRLRRH